jgi:hypothetical protein
MRWCVGLIDSCGAWPGASRAAAFVADGGQVERRGGVPDPTGHGSRIAALLQRERTIDLLLGQVFTSAAPTSGAAVAAAVDWAVAEGANLVHLSLGLAADRPVLGAAIARAIGRGVVVVASVPARRAPAAASAAAAVYPAAYAGVIRGTGDARCAPGELSSLGEGVFGACPRPPAPAGDEAGSSGGRAVGGASVGAAWVSWAVLGGPPPAAAVAEVVRRLTAAARYHGAERRPAPPSSFIASH